MIAVLREPTTELSFAFKKIDLFSNRFTFHVTIYQLPFSSVQGSAESISDVIHKRQCPSVYNQTMYGSVRKLYAYSIGSFLVTFVGSMLIYFSDFGDVFYDDLEVHNIIILTICLLSLMTAVNGYRAYVSTADPRIGFISMAFFVFATIFPVHALSFSADSIISHEFFDITEHYGPFFMAALLTVGSSLSALRSGYKVSKYRWPIFIVSQVLIWGFFSAILFSTDFAHVVEESIAIPTAATTLLIIGSIFHLIQQYKLSPHIYIYRTIIGLSVLANIGIIPFFYEEMNVLWWYFHMVILVSFLLMAYGIMIKWSSETGRLKIEKNS